MGKKRMVTDESHHNFVFVLEWRVDDSLNASVKVCICF